MAMTVIEVRKQEHNQGRSLASLRVDTINSVFRRGLLSGNQLEEESIPFLGSMDIIPKPQIGGRLIFPSIVYPEGAEQHMRILRSSLYLHADCVFPVLLERRNERRLPEFTSATLLGRREILSPAEIQLYEMRALSSFLVVAHHLEGDFSKYSVPTKKFITVIFPQQIWDEYATDPHSLLSPVPVRTTTETILRTVGYLPESIRVPDYESNLVEISNDMQRLIWIHGVRLPTMEDIV